MKCEKKRKNKKKGVSIERKWSEQKKKKVKRKNKMS